MNSLFEWVLFYLFCAALVIALGGIFVICTLALLDWLRLVIIRWLRTRKGEENGKLDRS